MPGINEDLGEAPIQPDRAGYLKAAAGALLGAAAGSLAMVFVNAALGFTILSGALVSFCAGRGFIRATRRAEPRAPWVCWAASIPFFLAAMLLSYSLPGALESLRAEGFAAAIQASAGIIRSVFEDAAVFKDFARDTGFCFLFLALGGLDIVNLLRDIGIPFLKKPG